VDHRLPGRPSGLWRTPDRRARLRRRLAAGALGRPATRGALIVRPPIVGRPRLAELTRSAVEAAVASSLRALGAEAGDAGELLPFAHIGGLLVLLRDFWGAPLLFRGRELEPVAGFPSSRWCDPIGRALDARRSARPSGPAGGRGDGRSLREVPRGGAPCVVPTAYRAAAGRLRREAFAGRVGADRRGGEISWEVRPCCADTGRSDAGTRDGWLPTGDAGSWTATAASRPRAARRPDRVGCENVWPGDVEAACAATPRCDCAVSAVPTPLGTARGGGGGARDLVRRRPRGLRDHVGALLGATRLPGSCWW